MISQLTGNWVCWAIVLLALVCYQQLLVEYFERRERFIIRSAGSDAGNNSDHRNLESSDREAINDSVKREFSGVLIGALPLLGLLGTIIGLLQCFAGIASEGASSELVSGGIADALLTTQLGLVCAIPGWLLQAWVKASAQKHAHVAVVR